MVQEQKESSVADLIIERDELSLEDRLYQAGPLIRAFISGEGRGRGSPGGGALRGRGSPRGRALQGAGQVRSSLDPGPGAASLHTALCHHHLELRVVCSLLRCPSQLSAHSLRAEVSAQPVSHQELWSEAPSLRPLYVACCEQVIAD